MESSRSFTVTFDCNSSKQVFPTNTVSNFRLRLPRTLHLNDQWRVGLADVTYTNARYTFDRPQQLYLKSADGKINAKVNVKAALYQNIEELVEEINRSIERAVQIERKPSLEIENGRVLPRMGHYLKHKKPIEVAIMGYSNTLHTILGVDRWGIPQLNARVPLIFVYCSIVRPTVVGDVEAKLLRMINTSTRNAFSATLSHVFRRIYYRPLDYHDIDEIEIQLLDDTGKQPLFKNGSFRVTLLFRHGPLHDAGV